jgi:hypothetical protein
MQGKRRPTLGKNRGGLMSQEESTAQPRRSAALILAGAWVLAAVILRSAFYVIWERVGAPMSVVAFGFGGIAELDGPALVQLLAWTVIATLWAAVGATLLRARFASTPERAGMALVGAVGFIALLGDWTPIVRGASALAAVVVWLLLLAVVPNKRFQRAA